jgi:hypothetical protein
MEDFTLALALYDFVPVALTAIAAYYVARLVLASGLAYAHLVDAGGVLVVAAGLSKAVWKLNATLTGQDIVWLSNLLFPLMAPGFALLAGGMWGAQRRRRGKRAWLWVCWGGPLLLIGVTYAMAAYQTWGAGVARGWFPPMMNLASLANITLTGLLFASAWREGRRGLAFLFLVNLGMVFALIPIAQMENHSIAMHWFEQTLTAVGAASFAYASRGLYALLARDRGPRRSLASSSMAPVSGD